VHNQSAAGIRVTLLVTVLGVVGLVVFLVFYDVAFPSASLELRYTRDEIRAVAEDYLGSRGYDLADYQHAVTFGGGGMTQIYLERTVGVAETNRLARSGDVSIWTWYVRYFRPLQKEEFGVTVRPTGEVVGFSRALLEDAAGAELVQAEAQVLAEDYLVNDRGLDLAQWELYDGSTRTRPNRADHTFTWVRRGFAVGDGDSRVTVVVRGDEVGSFSTWFRVPESFTRPYREQRGRASLLGQIALYASYAFDLAAVVGLAIAFRRGLIRWRMALWLALGVVLVRLLNAINWLALLNAWYDTTQDYWGFVTRQVLSYLSSSGFTIVSVLVLVLGGRWLGKQVWPRQDKLLNRTGDRWVDLARSCWRGTMLGGMSAGYVVLFYLIATRLGAWIPLDAPSSNLYATPFPFLSPLTTGLLPAVFEEFSFRLIGMALVMLLARRKQVLALLIPGLIWAFAHSGYLTDPIWLRGVELTIATLLLYGLFFLKFDLVTTAAAHYFYNALLTALPLLRSGNGYFVVSGLIVVLLVALPVLPGVLRWLRRRKRPPLPAPVILPGSPADREAALRIGAPAAALGDPGVGLFCLRAGGQVVGYALGLVVQGTGTVKGLYIEPAYRRRYHGSDLYAVLADWFREQGAERVRVTVPVRDGIATAFWDAQGLRLEEKGYGAALRVTND